MDWPNGSREELEALGFTFQRRTKCGSEICGATIEWWTGPSGRWIPFRVHPRSGALIQHNEECPGAKKFREPVEEKPSKLEKQQKAVAQRKEAAPQGRLF